MVKFITTKIKPTKGFSHFLHIVFVALLPLVVFGLVRLNLDMVALAVIVLGKWRMFAVKPRHWMPHIRTNAVDIIVGLGLLACMVSASNILWQLLWLALYEVWVLFIKPKSSLLMVSAQAMVAQVLGSVSMFLVLESSPLAVYVVLYGAIAYFTARHFLGSFDEPHSHILASQWAFFASALMWVLGHWLLFFGPVAQVAILLSTIGCSVWGLYYLHETDRLTKLIQRQIMVATVTVILVVIIFADWGDKAI